MVSVEEMREMLEMLEERGVASFSWRGPDESFSVSFMPEAPEPVGERDYDHDPSVPPEERVRRDLGIPPNLFPPRPAGYEVK